jgi:hypothetical protein
VTLKKISFAMGLALALLASCNSGHEGHCGACLEFTQERCDAIGKAAGCDSARATEHEPCDPRQPGGGNVTECEFEGCDSVPDCSVGL